MRRPPLRVLLWAAVVVAAWVAVLATGADPREVGADALRRVSGGGWAVPAVLIAYVFRGVVLFPATALALFAGYALGPVVGALVAWLGVLLSASVAYGLARVAGPRRTATERRAATATLRRDADADADAAAEASEAAHDARTGWRARLQRNAFEAILIARLAAVPGDVVNLVAGASRTPVAPFVAATALGGAPGLLAVVWAGASLEGVFEVRQVSVRPELIAASLAMAAVAVGLSRWIRRRSGAAS